MRNFVRRTESLGTCLREARVEAGLSGETTGLALGISRITVFRHETGEREPELELLGRYCDLYGVEILAIGPGEWAWKKTAVKKIAATA